MKLESLTESGRRSLRTPGMYIEWRAQSLAGRAALPTGVPVFVGFVKPGAFAADAPRARWFDRWERFDAAFSAARASPLLVHAVRGFFENGGERCLVVPVQADYDIAADQATYANAMQLAGNLGAPFDQGELLDDMEDIDLVCVPDAMTPVIERYRDWVFDVQARATEHCARMGERFALLDAMSVGRNALAIEKDDRLQAALSATIAQWQTLPARHGALYFPWIEVKALPVDGVQTTVRVPPCGHIAGVFARSDRRVGVYKAPGNEPLEGVVDIDFDLADTDQAALNEAGINCLREWPGRGLRVWGARTLCDRPELRYVNVTRLMLTVKRELEYHLRDLVFEPNNESLWGNVADRLTGYFADLYLSGALKGSEAAEAFFVKCDAETNSMEERDTGTVVALAGLAPVVPAEFLIVRITQSAAGVTVGGPATQI
jgi:uncharacterized protein